jgi:hypothetical protein
LRAIEHQDRRMIPAAPYAPDLAPLESGATSFMQNTEPMGKNFYGPCKALEAVTNALTARCQGAGSFRGIGGDIVNFAADATKLYLQTGAVMSDVSRLAGGAYNVPADAFVQFAQFGDLVMSVNGADVPQSWTIASSTNWAAAAGAPPTGRFITTARQQVFIGRLVGDEGAIQWCGIEDPTNWTPGTGQGDIQRFPDIGKCMGLAGGQGVYAFFENGIQAGTYLGVDPWWQFDSISDERGCAASGSIARFQRLVFFLSFDGFYMITPEGIKPIGNDLFDDTFWNGNATTPGVNIDHLHRVIATCDPLRPFYRVAYPSTDSSDGSCDRMLIYNWLNGRVTPAVYDLDYLYRARTGLGVTLEDLDALYPGGLETVPVSLDSYLFAGTAQETLAAFTSDKMLGFFQGGNLATVVDSEEVQIFPGKKAKVVNVRPHFVGAGTPTIKIGVRDNKLNDAVRFTSAVTQRATGRCPFNAKRTKGRFHKSRWEMAAGQDWSQFQGFDFDAVEAGMR